MKVNLKTVTFLYSQPSTIDSFSPPFWKNFNILCRAFKDYELVVGRRELWVLKSKRLYKHFKTGGDLNGNLFNYL